jgi:chromosome segregation ATPase
MAKLSKTNSSGDKMKELIRIATNYKQLLEWSNNNNAAITDDLKKYKKTIDILETNKAELEIRLNSALIIANESGVKELSVRLQEELDSNDLPFTLQLKMAKFQHGQTKADLETAIKNYRVKDSEVDGLREQVSILNNDLNNAKTYERDLKTKLELVEKLKKLHDRRAEKIIDEKNVEMELLQSDFNQTKEKLQHAEQSFEKAKIDFETILTENRMKLVKTEDNIKLKNAKIESLKNVIEEKNTPKAAIEVSLKQDLAKMNQNFATLHNVVQEKDSEIELLNLKLQQLQHSENDLKADTKTKEAEIVQLKANIDKLTKDLDFAESTIVFENHECKCNVKGTIADEMLKSEVENLKKTLKIRESENGLIQEEIKIRNSQIELRRQEIEQLREQLELKWQNT